MPIFFWMLLVTASTAKRECHVLRYHRGKTPTPDRRWGINSYLPLWLPSPCGATLWIDPSKMVFYLHSKYGFFFSGLQFVSSKLNICTYMLICKQGRQDDCLLRSSFHPSPSASFYTHNVVDVFHIFTLSPVHLARQSSPLSSYFKIIINK